jgi:beta-glucosidase
MPGFLGMFCRTTLPWHYLSRLERQKFAEGALYYSGGVVARTEGGRRVIRQGGFILREDDDLFVPAQWHDQEIIAYSRNGYENKAWPLPAAWSAVTSVDLYRITLDGSVPLKMRVPVAAGRLCLSLGKDEAVSVIPAGAKLAGGPAASQAAPPAAPASRAWEPEPGNPEWLLRHGEKMAAFKAAAGKLDLLFLGDSITCGWGDTGRAVWEQAFAPRRAVNLGIAGSQTSHLLWQLDQEALGGGSPRVAVLMIGVNNIMAAPSQTAADIAHGISAILERLRGKFPGTRVLLLGTFPKDRVPGTPDRRKIQAVNSLIAQFNDGQRVRFLDLSGRLLDQAGVLAPEVSQDGVHLTPQGYQLWAEAISPVIQEMLATAKP